MSKTNQAKWAERLKDFKISGQTQKTWCQATSINIHTLRYWLSKERKAGGTNSEIQQWLTLQVQDNTFNPNPKALYVQIGNFTVAVYPGFDPKHLLSVLSTLSAR